jgi:hypothetical protein
MTEEERMDMAITLANKAIRAVKPNNVNSKEEISMSICALGFAYAEACRNHGMTPEMIIDGLKTLLADPHYRIHLS